MENIYKGTRIIVKDTHDDEEDINYLVVEKAETNIYQLIVLNNSRLLPTKFRSGEAIRKWIIDNFKREDFIIINNL